ncbi:MAG: B12-binding domain-containing radical SAM protein [Acidimicrobiales bacterium]
MSTTWSHVPDPSRGRDQRPPSAGTGVVLIVPPGGQYTYPNLGPASLTGHLRGLGHDCEVIDLNVEGFHRICRPESIEALIERAAASDLGAEAGHRFSGAVDAHHVRDLLVRLDPAARRRLIDLPDRLRDPEILLRRDLWAETSHHLGLLANLVELAYVPLRFLPGSLIGGMFSALDRPEQWRRIATPYDAFLDEELARFDWTDHQIVGVSAFTFDQLVYAYRIAPELRRRAPHALLALGGNVLGESEIPPQLRALLADAFDVVVTGDGELAMERLTDHVAWGRPLDEVPNAFFERDGEVVTAPERYRYRFESVLAPDFSTFDLDRYLLPEPVLPFRLSNGCDWGRCTFCSESKDQGEITARTSYREPEPEQVAEHMADLNARYGVRSFVNCSSLVTAEGAADIGDAVVARDLDVAWYAMVRAEAGWTPERIDRAVAGGASALNFGIESFNPRINRMMKKGINLRQVPDQLRRFRERGVFVTLYTLCNFPTETYEEFAEHLETVRGQVGDTHDVSFKSNFMLVADAPVAEQPVDFGIAPEPLQARLDDLRDRPLPLYLVPDEGSGGPVYRFEGDRFEEKLDLYHSTYLRLALERPLYFNRDLEVVSLSPHWEPELALASSRLGTAAGPEALSLSELLESEVCLAEGVTVESLGDGLVALVDRSRPLARYYGGLQAALLTELTRTRTFAHAFGQAIEACDPSAEEVLELYEEVHHELRDLGVIEVVPGAVERSPAPLTLTADGGAR